MRVEGTAKTVDQAALDELIAKNVGTPLPRLNTTSLRNAMLEVRGVRTVTITRHWPRGLAVVVESRRPVAAVADSVRGDGYILLDSEAVQVGRANKLPKDLPKVEIPVGAENRQILESVLVVLEAMPSSLERELASVSAKTQDDITLELRDGVSVRWGNSSNNALKATVLDVVRSDEQNADVTNFDVSAPSAPIAW